MGETIRYECQSITPVLMSGIKNNVELRAPSIKGWMRYWWRAINAYNDINEMKNRENEIFGGMDKKSSFIIRVSIANKHRICNCNITQYRDEKDYQGINKGKEICIKGFENIKFEVVFRFSDNENVELISSLFEVCCIIGQIGKRSRRGYGSIVINKKNEGEYNKDISMENLSQKLNKIVRNSKGINQEYYNLKNKDEIINSVKIGSKYPYIESIIKSRFTWGSTQELLNHIGMATHNCPNNIIVNNRGRHASPVYVSIVQEDEKYYPIITKLYCIYNSTENISKVKNFMSQLISK